jgi:hypothetical protein
MITESEARTMGLGYAASIEDGLRLIEKDHPKARVAIFPSGGLIVPRPVWRK